MTPSWTHKAAVARTHRRLKVLKRKVDELTVAIAGDWSDEDQYMCKQVDDLKTTVEALVAKIAEDMDEIAAERDLAESIV